MLASEVMTPRTKWILLGIGSLALIGYYFYRRNGGGLGRARLVSGKAKQAPVVGGYDDGNMKTTIRASADMPIEERLASIQDLVYKSIQDPEMRKLALQVTSSCPERDGDCEARAIYDYVKANVRYTGDIAPIKWPNGEVDGIDLYQSARRTVEFGAGDCDDASVLIATLLALNGITPRLRVMKEDPGSDWSHIFPLAGLASKNAPTQWVALDATLPGNDHYGEEVPYAEALDFPA
jgi:transglutaminase-like putative cysteine protease